MSSTKRRLVTLILVGLSAGLATSAWIRTARWDRLNREHLEAAQADAERAIGAAQQASRANDTADVLLQYLKAQVDQLHESLRLSIPSQQLADESQSDADSLAIDRLAARRDYAAFFRTRGLSAAAQRKLIDLVVKGEAEGLQVDHALHDQNLSWKDPAGQAAYSEIGNETNAAEMQLLGSADFSALQDYNRSKDARHLVGQWAGGTAVMLGEPLSPQQGNALLKSIQDASAQYQKGSYLDLSQVDWDAVAESAQSYLTPSQLNFIETAEPPFPTGGRFQNRLTTLAEAARQSETPTPR